MKLYKSYSFRTKDPRIDMIRTAIEDAAGERVRHHHLARIEREGGPSSTAMHNWFFGKTRRPQGAAMEAALRTVGYETRVVRVGRVDIFNKKGK